jgi:hypothetical protein
VLCCVAVLFSARSPPHAVLLLATALSFSVAVRVLRAGARVTWVCVYIQQGAREAQGITPEGRGGGGGGGLIIEVIRVVFVVQAVEGVVRKRTRCGS